MTDVTKTLYVDCDAGRRLGCRTFCCRLLVALKPHEREARTDGLPAKGYVDKDLRGLCIHMDSETWKCKIWERRPETCREYACNNDFKLQVAVREGFSNIVDLARKSSVAYIPKETYIKVPMMSEDEAVAASMDDCTE
jgi:hypothetical protein